MFDLECSIGSCRVVLIILVHTLCVFLQDLRCFITFIVAVVRFLMPGGGVNVTTSEYAKVSMKMLDMALKVFESLVIVHKISYSKNTSAKFLDLAPPQPLFCSL